MEMLPVLFGSVMIVGGIMCACLTAVQDRILLDEKDNDEAQEEFCKAHNKN